MSKASDPISLGRVELKNRLILAPLKTALNAPQGQVTAAGEGFYTRIAQGGVGLVTLEPAAVSPDGAEHPKQLRLHADEHVAQVTRLVDAVHAADALVMVHINHAGRAANPKVIGGPPVAPTDMRCPTTGAQAQALTAERIAAIIEDFGAAALRAVQAGADLIELQLGHGYLVSQFLSERTNARKDAWGSDPSARQRFARQVAQAVLAAAGSVPVVARISGKEFVPGGLEPADWKDLLAFLGAEGLAAVHVGFGNACDSPPWYFNHMSLPMQAQDEVFRALRALTDLPLIAVGRMGDPARIEFTLADGLAGAVALGRPLVADPDLPRKLLNNKENEILPCGACLQGCLARVKTNQPISCLVNPWTQVQALEPAAAPRQVLVVGGGPAGVAAAIAAARRGHQTRLIERHGDIGGQFRMAVQARGKDMMTRVLHGLVHRLAHSGAQVETGTPVDRDLIASIGPDVVVLASGSCPRVPEIEGLEGQHVIDSFGYLDGTQEIRGPRVLVIGAGMVGMEVAELLVDEDLEVIVTKRSEVVAGDMEAVSRALMLKRLAAKEKLTLMPSTTVLAFEADGVRVEQEGQQRTLPPMDTVVLCAGMEPEASLQGVADELGIEVHVIGDAATPANIEAAFKQGWQVGATV